MKPLENSFILKHFRSSPETFLSMQYRKKNTYEWEYIAITVLHQVATHAKDGETTILKLLEILL
jgi:hypothetical protein